jgi:hypothetical protein
LAVIIPAAMGLGVLFSVALLFGDFYRRTVGIGSARRRADLLGASTAAETIHGTAQTLWEPKGLRPRKFYFIGAAGLLVVAAVAVPGATWNYFNPGGLFEGIAWVWAISSIAVAFILFAGVATLQAVPSFLPWFAVGVTVGYLIRLVTFLDPPNRISAAIGILVVGLAATVVATSWARHHQGLPTWVWPLFVATSLTTDTDSSLGDDLSDARDS